MAACLRLVLLVALVLPTLLVALLLLLVVLVPGLVSVRWRPLWPGPWRTR
ncbi:hypothetical protein ACWEPN_28480 [Nonomuraea wenchangensis]